MMKGRTLLSARWVIGHQRGHHVVHEHGVVVIEGTDVLYVGAKFEGEVARRIDYGEAVISPGFIDLDALSDLDTTILGYDNGPAWRKGRVWPESYTKFGPYEMYTPEELAFQKRHGAADCLIVLPRLGRDGRGIRLRCRRGRRPRATGLSWPGLSQWRAGNG